jgi:hypothetical protein
MVSDWLIVMDTAFLSDKSKRDQNKHRDEDDALFARVTGVMTIMLPHSPKRHQIGLFWMHDSVSSPSLVFKMPN